MSETTVQSTSQRSAICTDIILRDGPLVRLIFRPQLVENDRNPAASVKGRFLYQKKKTADDWQDFDLLPLTSVRQGQGYQLEIKSGELLPFLQELGALYRLHRSYGIPRGKKTFLQVEESLSALLALAEADLQAFLSDHPNDAFQTLQMVLRWFSQQTIPSEMMDGTGELPQINALVGLANMRSVLRTWSEHADNAEEEFWQQLFAQHSFVLSQLFAYPVVLIGQKAYVGGKGLSNSGGKIVDFLYRIDTSGAAVLIEIKTPITALLSKQYRGIYPPSMELNGSISQVLAYRESLMTDFRELCASESKLCPAEPYCIVIIGDASAELVDEEKRRSFERFRERLVGVRIITFDEVYRRIQSLTELFQQH